MTNAPPVINLYDDLDFVFNTAYDFKDRFAGEPDYFSAKGEQKGFLLKTNFVAGRGQPAADHAPRSAAPAAATSASTWPRAR